MIGRTTPIVFAAAKRSSEGLADHLLFSSLGLDRWHLWHLASKLLNYAEMKRNRRPKGPGVFHMGHDWEPNFEDDPGPWTLGSDGSGVHSKLRWTISQVSQVEALRRRGAERIRKDPVVGWWTVIWKHVFFNVLKTWMTLGWWSQMSINFLFRLFRVIGSTVVTSSHVMDLTEPVSEGTTSALVEGTIYAESPVYSIIYWETRKHGWKTFTLW